MEKQQILVIHGGNTFDSPEAYSLFLDSFVVSLDKLKYQKDWKDSLQEDLGSTYDVFQPRMPNATSAQYGEWKKIFEKIIEKVDDNLILIGHSLGALFLAKYLSENNSVKKIKSLFIIAAPFNDTSGGSLGSFVLDPSKVKSISKNVARIILYYSKDDPIVSFFEAEKYMRELPQATLRSFDSKGHFKQDKLPEIIDDLQKVI